MIKFLLAGFLGIIFCFSGWLIADDAVKIITCRGADIAPYSKGIAQLCNTVFREYPYLYEGNDAEYENFVLSYADSNNAVVSVLLDGETVVGAATGIPLSEAREHYKHTFFDNKYDLNQIFYLGELVLLEKYRGSGYGNTLYRNVEQVAKDEGAYTLISFCEIEESKIDAPPPPHYISKDNFWIKLGFTKHPELNFIAPWTNINTTVQTPHEMVFWLKAL